MDAHDLIMMAISVITVLGGFILSRQSSDIKDLDKRVSDEVEGIYLAISKISERVGKLEVNESEFKTDLKYIKDGLDEIRSKFKQL